MKEDYLERASDIALKADGFDEAIIGVSQQGLLIYDYMKCVHIMMSEGESEQDAVDWMDYNVVGSCMGEGTPIFLMNG